MLKFVDIQYERNDVDFSRGKFRVRGDVVELWPAYEEFGFRIELFGDEVETLAVIDPTSGTVIEKKREMQIYPAKHFVLPEERIEGAVKAIQEELEQRLQQFKEQGKLLEAQRLAARTRYDIEMLLEVGYCSGIENYSRPLSGRKPGETPNTLIDFFPADSLLFIDESHVSLGQIRGMFAGDFSRKSTLVEHGFRLPSALDNRPLRFDEWEKKLGQSTSTSRPPRATTRPPCPAARSSSRSSAPPGCWTPWSASSPPGARSPRSSKRPGSGPPRESGSSSPP